MRVRVKLNSRIPCSVSSKVCNKLWKSIFFRTPTLNADSLRTTFGKDEVIIFNIDFVGVIKLP
jgi:hypothetical protein